jgi:hypothetical protein
MKKSAFLLVFLVVILMISGNSFGIDMSGPMVPTPYGVFSTISSSSPQKGRAAVSVSVEKSGNPDFYRFSAQLATGLTDNIEFGMNIPYMDNARTGLEDIAISLKHRLLDGEGYSPSLAYLLTGSLGSGKEDLSTDGRIGAGIISGKKLGPLKGHVNFIYSIPRDTDYEDEMRFSAGLEFSAAHNLEVLAELYGVNSHFSNEVDKLEARFGYRIQYGRGVYTTLGAGFGLANKEPDYRILLSLTLSFPQRENAIEKTLEDGE